MIDTVLFDLDGTVADSIPIIDLVAEQACSEMQVPYSREKLLSLIGVPLLEIGEALAGPARAREFYDCYQKHFPAVHDRHIRLFPGMQDLLSRLKKEGFYLGLVTSKSVYGTSRSVSCLGLQAVFDVVVSASERVAPKPSPEPAALALLQLASRPERAVFVGDSLFDLQCGRQAGLRTVAVSYGAMTAEKLAEAAPDYLVDSAAELLALLLSLKEEKDENNEEHPVGAIVSDCGLTQ